MRGFKNSFAWRIRGVITATAAVLALVIVAQGCSTINATPDDEGSDEASLSARQFPGYVLAQEFALSTEESVRFWVRFVADERCWAVQILDEMKRAKGHAGACGRGPAASTTVNNILGVFVGTLVDQQAHSVLVSSSLGPASAPTSLHGGMFAVPASVATANERQLRLQPLDQAGKPTAPVIVVDIQRE